jgi:CRP-like cAMP-binding protein
MSTAQKYAREPRMNAATRNENASLLAEVPVIAALRPRVRDAVIDRAIVRALRRGGVVFWQGNPASYLTVVLQGYLKLVVNSAGGREVVADIVGPGSTPCWPAALHDASMPMSLIALQDCKVARVPITPVRHCISTDPRVALAYASMLGRRHDRLVDQILETRAASVPARLGGLLNHLLAHCGDRATGEIPVRLTRQDLADAAGTTVETAIRLMRKWEKAGIVETQRDGLRILDADALRNVADGSAH